MRELLLETPGRVATIPHPGVSALKKEHGILQSRPNISDIGKGSRLQYLCIQYVLRGDKLFEHRVITHQYSLDLPVVDAFYDSFTGQVCQVHSCDNYIVLAS